MPSTQLRTILYIEDDAGLARLLQKRLTRNNLEVTIAESAETAHKILRGHEFDLILVDYHLPGQNGLGFIREFLGDNNNVPVILLTAGGDERLAIEALQIGAADYAVKDVSQIYLELLPQIMQSAFTKYRLQKENENQRRAIEAAIVAAEAANEAKTTFLASISHEIRTPLNVISGLTYALIKKIDEPETQRILKTIENNSQALRHLIDDLLDITKIEDKKIELEEVIFKFSEIFGNIENSFGAQINAKGLQLILENKIGETLFSGDKFRIMQIMNNMVSNAIKFTENGFIKVIAEPSQNGVTFKFIDSGSGIEPENIEKIFDKFTQANASITRRFGGTGLGLTISRSLSQAMGGNLTVESEVGKGTIFTLELPLKSATYIESEQEFKAETTNETQDKGMVLIVEDYMPNIMVAEMLLAEFGYSTIAVKSGEEAIDLIKKSDAPYHAILMDIEMNGIDGFETTEQIREIEISKGFRNVIFGVTAHGLAGDRENCINSGMDDFIAKPIDPETLRLKLGKR
jgi:signal transduction histidine kinase